MMAEELLHEDEETAPVLELDPEAAADAAAPGVPDPPAIVEVKISLQEMCDRLMLRILDGERLCGVWTERGLDVTYFKHCINVDYATANAISFMMDHESDIREHMRQKREQQNKAIAIRKSRR